MNQKTDILFSRKYGRHEFLASLLLYPLDKMLHARTRKHTADCRRQLAVFAFDDIAHSININGVYERKELETFFDWLERFGEGVFDGIALDIGANIGNHSLFFSDYFKRVLSFEPNPNTYRLLAINSSLTDNVECFEYGLSDANSEAALTVNNNNMGASSVSEKASEKDISIQLRKLDDVLEAAEQVRLVKIDVEGHEYKALLGAEKTIAEHKPILLFEQHVGDFVDGHSKVISLLKRYGYRRFATVKKYPVVPEFPVRMLAYLYAALARLIHGETMKIVLQKDIKPGFYHFVVAVPDWLDVS